MPLEHILKNSSQSGKEPTAGHLDYGEISLNFHEDGPFICCKDTSGAVRRIAGIWVNNTAPATPTPGVWWLDTSVSPAQAKVYESAAAGWLIVGSGGGGGGGGGLTGIAASAPLTSTGGATPTLGITNATLTAAGAMSAADKTKLDGLSNYTLPIATSTKAGGVMVGDNLVIAAGRLSAQLPGALIYKGTIDLTAAAPATRVTGDTYVNSKAGTIEASWTGLSGSAAAGDMVLWGGSTWDRVGATGFGVTSVTGAAPITIAGTAASPEVGVSAATAAATGVVRLADAAAITAGTAGRVVDAAQLSAATPDASTTAKGLVQLADAAAVLAGTAGRMVDAAQLKSAQAAASGSATAPTTPTAGQVWVDSSVTPAVIKVWNGTTWVAQSGATITSATAPAAPATGQIWVDSSVTPNVTKIWDGTTWVTATPDGAAVAAIANDAKYATKTELATENTWDRTGTSLAPANAGDVVTVSAGTAALPGLTPVGDPDTGIWSPGADQLALSVNGGDALRITADGKVGIGTSTPTAKLHVFGNMRLAGTAPSAQTVFAEINAVNSFTTVNPGVKIAATTGTGSSQHELALYTSDDNAASTTEKVRINALGYVGIGVTSPLAPLHVATSASTSAIFDCTGGTQGFVQLRNTGGSAYISSLLDDVIFATSVRFEERVRITAAGKVGIGTSVPTATLTVKGNANITTTPVYADNAAALAGGLVAGDIYRKADGTLMITF